ncbi:MAG: type II secretion system F family protein [Chloroflexaceae bacterium]
MFSPELLSIFVALVGVLLLVIIGLVWWLGGRGEKEVTSRLTEFIGPSDAESAVNPRQALERFDRVVVQSRRGGNIQRDLAQADVKLTVTEFIIIKIVCALAGAAFGAFVGRASLAAMFASGLVGAVVFSFLPNVYLIIQARRRIKAFNNQLGDAITMMANALRGGYSFLQTLDMVAREAPAPMSSEFRRVVQEVGLGRSTEDALQNLLRRMPSDDLDILITAVNIQMEVGGNLAQILDMIGHTIRERVRIEGEIQTLTAQGRISAWVITGLPVGLGIFISMVNPGYMAPIFTLGMPPEAWCCLPVTAGVMIVIGYFAIMKIIDIDV